MMKHSIRDVVLMCISSAGGQVAGRTTIQKLTYFSGLKTGIKTFHHPHYYGPYSEVVTKSLSSLISLGLIEENEIYTANGRKLYTYSLTEFGRTLVLQKQNENEEIYEEISDTTRKCDETSHLDSDILAFASKVHYIGSHNSNEKPVSYNDIREKARELGWRIGESEFSSGVKLLVALGLAESA